jgi:hypothetical protein
VPVDHAIAAIVDIVDALPEGSLSPANVHWKREN